eukprot:CCRYP_007754-RG/>CCRYP_007754-RG protein AED:0.49 eAED:0.68 QI:0/0/0/1/0/0/2/0/69
MRSLFKLPRHSGNASKLFSLRKSISKVGDNASMPEGKLDRTSRCLREQRKQEAEKENNQAGMVERGVRG